MFYSSKQTQLQEIAKEGKNTIHKGEAMGPKSKPKKSWQEKLADSKDLPKVVKITGKTSKRWGTGTVVIPAPVEVAKIMKIIT